METNLCCFLVCGATAIAARAQTFTNLANFDYANGATPYLMSMVQGHDGNLYGTTAVGGAHGPFGTVFKVTPAGTLTTVHSFAGFATEGAFPTAGLIQSADGNFYGTTEEDGTTFYGTVFKVTPDGTLMTLHSFCFLSGCADGGQPDAALVQGIDGNFYGTTQLGGANNYGTVFKITPAGTLTTIYSFCALSNCADGTFPNTWLVQTSDGNLYGTTSSTVFKITSAGTLTTLHTLSGDEGSGIVEGLIQASDGNFYGTASAGGPNGSNSGTVFRITPAGILTTLYSFCSQLFCIDGNSPAGALVQASDGNLYGTTELGGAYTSGTVFKITPGGTLRTLYSLCAQSNCADGSRPFGGLVQHTNGKLYGTTYYGGPYDEGTVFSLDMGLGPFVKTQPAFGSVGSKVIILGTNLTGTTSVSFNGTPATFTVVSSSEIKTTVPKGATTGKIQVTTPQRPVFSPVAFQIIR